MNHKKTMEKLKKIKRIQKILALSCLVISLIIFLLGRTMAPIACYVLLCGVFTEIQAR